MGVCTRFNFKATLWVICLFVWLHSPSVVGQTSESDEIIPVGVPQALLPHIVSAETAGRIRRDSEQRALIESRFFMELYANPEALYRDFPELRFIIPESPFYRPDYWKARGGVGGGLRPSLHISGADYFPVEPDSFVVLEQNTTNIGGVLELWRMQRPGADVFIESMLRRMERLDQNPNAFRVYFTEEKSFGLEWEDFRRLFRERFGWVLVSGSEIEGKRFEVRDQKLFFLDDDLSIRQVTAFVSHFEPDLFDPRANLKRPMDWNELVVHSKVEELKRFELRGFEQAMRSASVLMLNEPGQDISSSKALLAFMPALRKRYFGPQAEEIIPTVETHLFIGRDGLLVRERLSLVFSQPEKFVIKDHYRIGGGDGVYLLEGMSASQRQDLILKISRMPHRYLYQPRVKPRLTAGLYRVELRVPVVAEANFVQQNSQVVASSTSLFARGSSSDKANLGANLSPSEANKVLSESEARSTKSFVVRVQVGGCADWLPHVVP
jgi:hypothetical protein